MNKTNFSLIKMTQTYSDTLRSDLPGELREKIKLWEVLNKILKNNGFIDADNIIADLANLKEKLNILLSEVLGVEHEIDGIHNYDDTAIKTRLDNLTASTTTALTDIQADIHALTTKLSSINSSSSTFEIMKNDNSLALSPSHIDMNQEDGLIKITSSWQGMKGSYYQMSADQTSLLVNASTTVLGQITVGGSTSDSEHPNGNNGINIESDNYIHTTLRNLNHYVNVNDDKVAISDVNGLVIEPDGTAGIKIRDMANTKIVHIPWQ